MAAAREPALHARPVVGAALVSAAAALWATFGLFAKHLYAAGFAPLELASVRAFVGFAGLLLFVLIRSATTRAPLPRLPLRALPFFVLYGVIGFALFEYLFFAALERVPVSVAVALLYTAPAFVVLASAVFWRERIDPPRWLALALVLCGVMLVTGAAGALLARTAALSATAVAIGIGSGMTYALYTMLSKLSTERYGPATSLFWSFGFATVALAVIASPIAPLLREPQHVPALLALGIVPTLLPYTLFLLGLRAVRASTAALLASTEPAIASVLAAVVLGERFAAGQALGIALIVSGAILVSRRASEAWIAPATGSSPTQPTQT